MPNQALQDNALDHTRFTQDAPLTIAHLFDGPPVRSPGVSDWGRWAKTQKWTSSRKAEVPDPSSVFSMKRREFIKASAMLVGAAAVPGAMRAAANDAAVLKALVADYYRLYYVDVDQDKYRALLTEDYLLLEQGDIQDVEKDITFMPKPADEYRRVDAFDFKSLKIHGDTAYAVYVLRSDIQTKKEGATKRAWLESMIFRQGLEGRWQIALLHSTGLEKA